MSIGKKTSVVRPTSKSQHWCYKKTKHAKFPPKINIYCFLVCNTSFETYPFALLPTNDNSKDNENFH